MSVGQALAAKRGERGLSIDQVAASTRTRTEPLRALEANAFGRFPAPVYARGCGKTHAMYHGLDRDELVRLIPEAGNPPSLALGPVGAGVARREFSSQTSPQVPA